MLRKHLRLKEFDYSSPNFYFVTVCTKNREKIFIPKVDPKYANESTIVAAASYAAKNTHIAENNLLDLSRKYFNNLIIDFYCFMSDHMHFIIGFEGIVAKKGAIGSRSYSLANIITIYKSLVSRDIGIPCWQPNYYEHITRSEQSLNRIRNYILNNPSVEYEKIPWKTIDPAV